MPRWSEALGSLVLAATLAAGCDFASPRPEPSARGTAEQPVVYGTDDRTEPYQFADAELAEQIRQAAAALISPDLVDDSNPSDVRINGPTLEEDQLLCPDERFAQQPVAAWCTGTLIAPDLVLTAGHCVTSLSECRNTRLVFGFEIGVDGQLAPLTAKDVYSCAEPLVRISGAALDYGVLRLDRRVEDRQPVSLRMAEAVLSEGTPVVLAGYPSGLPLKIAGGAVVNDGRASTRDYFVANVDAFGANSGSGVFLAETGELAGTLVRGATDYYPDGSCDRVNVCAESGCPGEGEGEDVVYLFNAVAGYCETGAAAPFCSCGDASCEVPESSTSCPEDCGTRCGDGVCNGLEGPVTCAADCGRCGDGTCDSDESRADCCPDCGCAANLACQHGACVPAADFGDTCAAPVKLSAAGVVAGSGTTSSASNAVLGSCGGEVAPDRIYTFTLGQAARMRAAVIGYDTVLYLRTSCNAASSDIDCNDDIDIDLGWYGSRLDADLAPGTYFLVVDGHTTGGWYDLNVVFGDVGGRDCAGALPIEAQGTQVVTGSTVGATHTSSGSCRLGSTGPERVYRFTLQAPAGVVAEARGVDTVLYVRSACEESGTELECNDDSSPPGSLGSRVALSVLDPGTYYLFVDSLDPSQLGSYTLTVAFDECPSDPDKTSPGACGCGTPDTDSNQDGIVDCEEGRGGAGGQGGAGEPVSGGIGGQGGVGEPVSGGIGGQAGADGPSGGPGGRGGAAAPSESGGHGGLSAAAGFAGYSGSVAVRAGAPSAVNSSGRGGADVTSAAGGHAGSTAAAGASGLAAGGSTRAGGGSAGAKAGAAGAESGAGAIGAAGAAGRAGGGFGGMAAGASGRSGSRGSAGGCGCAVPGGRSSHPAVPGTLLLGLGLLGAGRGRRRAHGRMR